MSSSQDKQLPATERKLQKARSDGQAARSRDLSHLAILGVGALGLLALAPWFVEYLQRALRQQLVFDAATVQATGTMLQRLQTIAGVGVLASLAFALLTSGAVLLAAVGAGGWIYSLKPITPQFNRLNPLSGFANLFSKQQLTNVSKMVLMTTILSFVAWRYMSDSVEKMAQLVLQPSPLSLGHAGQWVVSGVALLLLVVFVFAVIDVPLQAFFFKQRLKMSHEEVKQEHKESDGNPQLKGKQRQRAREIADRASITAVPKADFVVMNPTHYAVALKYDPVSMGAPMVVAKGENLLAQRIKELGRKAGVPVLEEPPLARALYAAVPVGQYVPANLFHAVAEVLAWVYSLRQRTGGRRPTTNPQGAI